MNQGWIKLHRQLLDWEWYDEPNTFRLFIHLLLMANHTENRYRGKVVKIGCLLTSRDRLALETGLSVRQVRTALYNLETTNEVASKKTSKGTEIQIVKYKDYQVATSETASKRPAERPTNDQQTTTNNNDKKEKNEKEERFNFRSALIELGFESKLVSEWLKVRDKKKLTNSETALQGFMREVSKSGEDCNHIMRTCIEKSWGGFQADWMPKPDKPRGFKGLKEVPHWNENLNAEGFYE